MTICFGCSKKIENTSRLVGKCNPCSEKQCKLINKLNDKNSRKYEQSDVTALVTEALKGDSNDL